MSHDVKFSLGTYFHGTKADLKIGEFEDDPNVTDKKFKGNPTKSYRTRYPLKIVAEAVGWKGHDPEVLQAMLDNLARIKEAGIRAIE